MTGTAGSPADRAVTAVSAVLRHLEQFRHLFSGSLCTIDLQNDPVATYDAFVAFGLPKLDFLLPHGIWHSAHRESPSG